MASETPTPTSSEGKDKKRRSSRSSSSRSSKDSKSGKHRSSRESSSKDGKHRSSRDGKHRSSRGSGSGSGEHRSKIGSGSGGPSSSKRPSSKSEKAPNPIKGDGTRGGEVARKVAFLRYYILYTSGGWLGSLLMSLSDVTGLWEITFLAILFIISWTILRIGQVEITLILGHIYDLIIPLQHQIDPTKQSAHAKHLEQYWPIFFIGSIIEFGCFFLVHPDLFTLVACLKTLILTILWMGKDSKGNFLTDRFGGKGDGGDGKGSDGRDRGDRGDRDRGKRDDGGISKKDDSKSREPKDDSGSKKKEDGKKKKDEGKKKKPSSDSDSDKNKKKKDDKKKKKDDGDSKKNPYVSKGFDGNLMPITNPMPEGPKRSRRRSK